MPFVLEIIKKKNLVEIIYDYWKLQDAFMQAILDANTELRISIIQKSFLGFQHRGIDAAL